MMFWRRLAAAIVCLCLLPASTASGVAESVAPLSSNLQLTLLGKVLSFDRSLGARTNALDVAILYQADFPESEQAKIAFMRAARASAEASGATLRFKPVILEGKPSFRDVFAAIDADVAYVMPLRGLDVSKLAVAAAGSGVRTFSGVPEYVYDGVSVTLGVKHGRPAIFVNLKTARAQGSDFSSQLLKLAQVIE